jgi:signal transduction histidine kinase
MRMFQSATLKLTGWYLALLMGISFIFSAAIYQLNTLEVNTRLENFQQDISAFDLFPAFTPTADQIRIAQAKQASDTALTILLNVNLAVFITGGLASFVLARRTLRPIEKAHEAQGRFTGDASHELRTPLAAMKTEIEVALHGGKISATDARELLESNLEEVNKLIALSEFLLKLARLDYNKLERCPVNLKEVASSTLKRFPNQKRRITIVPFHKKAIAHAEEASVEELMTILIDNALKYSRADSKIVIKFFDHGLTTGFSVTNEGETIPQEVQHKLFHRFYRAESSRTNSSQNGYGLGLAIAKKIAEVHHGDVAVKSKDGSTTFSCTLPNRRNMQART